MNFLVRVLTVVALSVVSLWPANGAEYQYERGGVLFYAGFDKGRDAVAVGDGKAILRDGGGQVTADGVDSVRGSALRSGDGIGSLAFSAEGNVLPDEGTVEIWIRTADWEGDDANQHIFLDIQGDEGGNIRFYKGSNGLSTYWVQAPGVPDPKHFDDKNPGIVAWSSDCQHNRKRWVLYFFIWKKGEFIDIKRGYLEIDEVNPSTSKRDAAPVPSPGRLHTICIGDFGGGPDRHAQTLIDEVYIYNRALTYEECYWATRNALTRKQGMDIPVNFAQPKANVVPNPAKNTLVVEIDSGDRSGNFAGTAHLEPAAGTAPAPIVRKEGRFGEAVIPYSDLPKGEYKVICDLRTAEGKPLAGISAPLVVPGPPVWLTEKVGVSETPPPPWTPIKAQGKRLRIWGRTYDLGAFGLPEKIVTHDQSILAGPITYKCVENGKLVAWRPTQKSVEKKTDAAVSLQGTSTSALGKMEWRVRAEYDGFLLHDLALTPAPGTKCDLMELRIPIRREFAYLWYKGTNERGFLPKGTGALFKTNFGGYWWIGTDEFGLCGATEHTGANIDDAKDAFSIVREENGDITVVYRFVGKPTALQRRWDLRLVLQATPTKPLPKDWRAWRDGARSVLTPGYAHTLSPAAPWPHEAMFIYFPFPVVKDANWYRGYVKGFHEKKGKVLPYSIFNCMAPGMPEAKFHWKEWFNPLAGPTSLEGWQQYAAVRPVPSYIDFMVWKHRELIRDYGHDGFYVDFAGLAGPVLAVEHGLGYERDGIQHPVPFPIVAWREVWKRMYTMLREEKQGPVIVGHTSTNAYAPMLSFCDVWCSGEHNWTGPLRDNYLEVLPLDVLRAEFRAQAHGGVPWWLPQLKQASLEDKDVATRDSSGNIDEVSVERSHHLLGLGLLLDISVWQTDGMRQQARIEYWAVQDKFGIADAKFFGYWKNSDPSTSLRTGLIVGQTEEMKASVYKKPKGGALVVVYNTTRQPKTANLTIAWEKLKGEGALKVVDAYTEKPVEVSNKSVAIEVPPLNYRLLWVR